MRFSLRLISLAIACSTTLFWACGAAMASESWVKSQASPGITRLNDAVSYKIEPPNEWVSNTNPIKRVDAHLQYQSDATVISQLCLANSYRCVTLSGSSFTTDVFNGEPGNSEFLLVHTVTRWNGSLPTLFIKSSISVWSGH